MKIGGTLALWLFGSAFVFAGFNIHAPYVNFLHGAALAILLIAGFAVFVLIKRGYWRAGKIGRLLVLLWCLPYPSMLYAHAAFEVCKRNVLHTDAAQAHMLGQHFVVGYTSFDEVAPLAEQGLIAGIYVARHNIAGRSTQVLKSEIAALQERRRVAGLPPLIVAADQEGGIVSLSGYHGRIRHAFLVGEAAPAFADTLGSQVPHSGCGELAAAVTAAHDLARHERRTGAVVLLSPAAASFDQFANFEARGEAFRRLVEALPGRRS